MSTHANRVQMTVSGTPGTGTITLNAASSGYRSFATAYGANATVDVLITEGTSWEVARDCTYTHSGTTLSRGTLESSSTGGAVSFTSAAVVSVIATAGFGNDLEKFLTSDFVAVSGTGSQSASNGVWAKITLLGTEAYDPLGWFDSTTNYRFQPTRAGIYVVSGSISNSQTSASEYSVAIYKNGTIDVDGPRFTTTYPNVAVSGLIRLNGSTDYAELWGINWNGSPAVWEKASFRAKYVGPL